MIECVLTIFSVFIVSSTLAGNVHVKIHCDGTSHSQQFKTLFSLDIILDGVSQIHLEQGRIKPEVTPFAAMGVSHQHGSLSDSKPFLKATLDIDCSLVDKLECDLLGYDNQEKAYRNVTFKPIIHFNASVTNGSIRQHKLTYMTEDVSLVICSANVGIKHTKWSWQVLVPGDIEYRQVENDNIQVFPSVVKQCTYYTVTRLIYIMKEPGEVKFKCMIAGNALNVSAMVHPAHLAMPNEETLGTVLFLSTMILVDTHFIVLPCVFAKWNQVFSHREKDLMLKWRAFISCIIGFIFLTIGGVTCRIYRDAAHMTSYLAFTVTEFLFIMAYAAMRFVSKYVRDLTEKQKGILNNARVSTSFGAVLVPIIYWIVIRIQGGVGNIVLEIIFYFVSTGAILSFVCVSFGREGRYWDDKLA